MLLVTSQDDYQTSLDDDDIKGEILETINETQEEVGGDIKKLEDRMSNLGNNIKEIKTLLTQLKEN